MKTKGFTLVELLVVIAILAILATVSVVGYTSFIQSADKVPAQSGAEAAANLIYAETIPNNECKLGTATVNIKDGAIAADGTATSIEVYVVKTSTGVAYEGRYTESSTAKKVTLTDVAKIALRTDNADWKALTENGGYLKLAGSVLSYCTEKYTNGVAIEVK